MRFEGNRIGLSGEVKAPEGYKRQRVELRRNCEILNAN